MMPHWVTFQITQAFCGETGKQSDNTLRKKPASFSLVYVKTYLHLMNAEWMTISTWDVHSQEQNSRCLFTALFVPNGGVWEYTKTDSAPSVVQFTVCGKSELKEWIATDYKFLPKHLAHTLSLFRLNVLINQVFIPDLEVIPLIHFFTCLISIYYMPTVPCTSDTKLKITSLSILREKRPWQNNELSAEAEL